MAYVVCVAGGGWTRCLVQQNCMRTLKSILKASGLWPRNLLLFYKISLLQRRSSVKRWMFLRRLETGENEPELSFHAA
jgi:hypothetical protein